MYDYSKKKLINCLKRLGIKNGDILYCHTNISFFGKPFGGLSKKNIYSLFIDGIRNVIGKNGTLILPSFTYSHSNGKLYNPTSPETICGILPTMMIEKKLCRSLDPNLSVISTGRFQDYFTSNIPDNPYGKNSFFDRFCKSGGKLCNFNLKISDSTFIHYLERKIGVYYRFDKKFKGEIVYKNKKYKKNSYLFVKDLSNKDHYQNFDEFELVLKNIKEYKRQKLGKGFISCIDVNVLENFIKERLKKNKNFLINKKS